MRVTLGQNSSSAMAKHMESQECRRGSQAERLVTRMGCFQKDVEVVGRLVCFPWSVHKLLGHSNEKSRKRLEAMTNGPYGIRDMKAALAGTGVSLARLKLEPPMLLESLSPGSYVFGKRGHMVGVCVSEDHDVKVHDNLGFLGKFSPAEYYCAWKVCFTNCLEDGPKLDHREVVGEQVCFPWSVHKLLGDSNTDAQKRLEAMSKGPYGIHDIRAALEGTGVKLVRQKLQDQPLPESLSSGSYVVGRRGHVIGLCVREDHSLEVYDNTCLDGVGQFSPADYYCAWKLSSG